MRPAFLVLSHTDRQTDVTEAITRIRAAGEAIAADIGSWGCSRDAWIRLSQAIATAEAINSSRAAGEAIAAGIRSVWIRGAASLCVCIAGVCSYKRADGILACQARAAGLRSRVINRVAIIILHLANQWGSRSRSRRGSGSCCLCLSGRGLSCHSGGSLCCCLCGRGRALSHDLSGCLCCGVWGHLKSCWSSEWWCCVCVWIKSFQNMLSIALKESEQQVKTSLDTCCWF